MPDTRSDPWGLGVARSRPRAAQRRQRRVRKGVRWRTLCNLLAIRWRTLAYVASELGIPRGPLSDEDAAKVRSAIGLARAERAGARGHRSALARALARDDTGESI
jgi:hypothetical protein